MIPTLALGQLGRSSDSAAAATDPYFANVVLLVDASNESNGGTPSTIDVIGKTPTWRNNAQIKTDQARFGSSSIYLDGTNDRVSFPDSADWAMGTGDATWEMWIRPEGSFSGQLRIALCQSATFGGFFSMRMYRNTGDLYTSGVSDGSTTTEGTAGSLPSDTWTHIMLCRAGATLYRGIDGVVGSISSALGGVTLLDSSGAMCLGGYGDVDNASNWKGWIDQVRITKGVARYTANFTAPAAAFPHS